MHVGRRQCRVAEEEEDEQIVDTTVPLTAGEAVERKVDMPVHMTVVESFEQFVDLPKMVVELNARTLTVDEAVQKIVKIVILAARHAS